MIGRLTDPLPQLPQVCPDTPALADPVVRRAVPEDAAVLAELQYLDWDERVLGEIWIGELVEEWKKAIAEQQPPAPAVWVAEEPPIAACVAVARGSTYDAGSEPIGPVIAEPDSSTTASLVRLHVCRNRWESRVPHLLIDGVVGELRSAGYRTVVIRVDRFEGQVDAFFERAGWRADRRYLTGRMKGLRYRLDL